MEGNGRDTAGRFAPGNPGGPGRPRRLIEQEYLAALSDAVALSDWNEVVCRAVADAKAGDAKARDWLSRYLLGSQPPDLMEIAADEARGMSAEEKVSLLADKMEIDERHNAKLDLLFNRL